MAPRTNGGTIEAEHRVSDDELMSRIGELEGSIETDLDEALPDAPLEVIINITQASRPGGDEAITFVTTDGSAFVAPKLSPRQAWHLGRDLNIASQVVGDLQQRLGAEV